MSADAPPGVTVRVATDEEFYPALRVVEGALLDVAASRLQERVTDGDVWVAVREGRVLGALVLDGDHVDAIAVRRHRRGRGIGSALVAAALDARGRLTVDFRPAVRPFYESLGFRITERDGRLWGVREKGGMEEAGGTDGTGG